MSAMPHEWIVDNDTRATAEPRLSVLIPFLRDDPSRLLASLCRQADEIGGDVELVLLDDGGGDQLLSESVSEAVLACALPTRLVRLSRNEGRSRGRNRLAAHARADYLLFLDADMLPDSPRFLAHWLSVVEESPPVVFGGFSVKQAPPLPEHALHRRLCEGTDCAPAAVRRRDPEKYVFTSNLLVRREVFDAEAFDERFTGWGWEDVEWGIRVGRRWPVAHVDNPATHLGLDRAPVIAAKYEQSAGNFARISQAHPDVVSAYASHRAARLLRPLPLKPLWRPLLKRFALAEAAPLAMRAIAMRLYRAALYAEAI
ncbi:MAG TPA: glycosyltransferase family A protein [Caulobacteraceae bacterium]|jgi:glycosyltransferase involved in cell wall biosynthesis